MASNIVQIVDGTGRWILQNQGPEYGATPVNVLIADKSGVALGVPVTGAVQNVATSGATATINVTGSEVFVSPAVSCEITLSTALPVGTVFRVTNLSAHGDGIALTFANAALSSGTAIADGGSISFIVTPAGAPSGSYYEVGRTATAY